MGGQASRSDLRSKLLYGTVYISLTDEGDRSLKKKKRVHKYLDATVPSGLWSRPLVSNIGISSFLRPSILSFLEWNGIHCVEPTLIPYDPGRPSPSPPSPFFSYFDWLIECTGTVQCGHQRPWVWIMWWAGVYRPVSQFISVHKIGSFFPSASVWAYM
jgi:hypothetical protein